MNHQGLLTHQTKKLFMYFSVPERYVINLTSVKQLVILVWKSKVVGHYLQNIHNFLTKMVCFRAQIYCLTPVVKQ